MASNRFGLAAVAVIATVCGASSAQASVVESKIGTLNVEANVAAYNGFREPALQDSGFDDAIAFINLSSLTASTSASVSGEHASSFLAIDARADWASPDHGTATFNTLGSAFYDGSTLVDGGKVALTANAEASDLPPFGSGRPTPFWQYNFTPTVDAYFTLDISAMSSYPEEIEGAAQYDGQFYLLINDVFKTTDLFDGRHAKFFLEAGQNYTFGLDPYLRELYTANTEIIDDTNISTFTMTFDITAADGPPGGGGGGGGGSGGVPEPAAWALMILGFGATGSALRRRRRPGAFEAARH